MVLRLIMECLRLWILFLVFRRLRIVFFDSFSRFCNFFVSLFRVIDVFLSFCFVCLIWMSKLELYNLRFLSFLFEVCCVFLVLFVVVCSVLMFNKFARMFVRVLMIFFFLRCSLCSMLLWLWCILINWFLCFVIVLCVVFSFNLCFFCVLAKRFCEFFFVWYRVCSFLWVWLIFVWLFVWICFIFFNWCCKVVICFINFCLVVVLFFSVFKAFSRWSCVFWYFLCVFCVVFFVLFCVCFIFGIELCKSFSFNFLMWFFNFMVCVLVICVVFFVVFFVSVFAFVCFVSSVLYYFEVIVRLVVICLVYCIVLFLWVCVVKSWFLSMENFLRIVLCALVIRVYSVFKFWIVFFIWCFASLFECVWMMCMIVLICLFVMFLFVEVVMFDVWLGCVVGGVVVGCFCRVVVDVDGGVFARNVFILWLLLCVFEFFVGVGIGGVCVFGVGLLLFECFLSCNVNFNVFSVLGVNTRGDVSLFFTAYRSAFE